MNQAAAGALTLLLFFSAIPAVQAGLVFNGTRVIYPAGKQEVTLALSNEDREPRLIQAWIEREDGQADGIPFIITPPIFRLDPARGQTLRIRYTGGAMPQDRESVLRINVLEVQPPPKGKKAGTHNYMQIPVRTRLKLFWRPKNLPGTPGEAATALRWRLLREGGKAQLECTNPSAFNVSLQDVRLTPPGNNDENLQSGMCPAKGRALFGVPDTRQLPGGTVYYAVINDGGYISSQQGRYGN